MELPSARSSEFWGNPDGDPTCRVLLPRRAITGGILSLTRALALELAPYRIRVNAIAPGLTDTAQPRYGSSEAEIFEMARSIPLGRMAQPEEIARAAVFLASENAGFVTGQTRHVNGGSCLA
jgi:NAD(P)-dependent dehydrogenase (short-subunit alcohol dehydrogenase family)